MSFLFKNYSLVEVIYLLIRFNKTKFFLCKKNNTDGNGVNGQQTSFFYGKNLTPPTFAKILKTRPTPWEVPTMPSVKSVKSDFQENKN